MKRIVIMLSILALQVIAADPQIEWFKMIDYGGQEKVHGLDIGLDGDLFFTGESNNGVLYLELQKFSSEGDSLWRTTYSENNGDIGYDLVVLPDGDIAVVGIDSSLGDNPQSISFRFGPDGSLIKPLLVPAYTRDAPPVIAARHEDSCYIGTYGEAIASQPRIKYYLLNSDWQVVKDYTTTASKFMTGMVIGSSGSFYQVRPPCGWGKMSYDLEGLGVKDYEGNPGEVLNATGLAISSIDELYCCGDVLDGSERDFFLLKWDTLGFPIWGEGNHKRYNLGSEEYCLDVTLDDIADCYLAGYQVVGEEEDVALVKTDSAGNMLWSWIYEMEGDQQIEGIEVDEEGYIYLAGSHHNGENWDMLLMKVRQPLEVSGFLDDGTDNSTLADVPIVITGDTTLEILTDSEAEYSVQLYNGGTYTITPQLPGWVFDPPSVTYDPLAHRMPEEYFWGEWTAVKEEEVTSSVRLECNSSEVSFTLPQSTSIRLIIYDVSGREAAVLAEGTYPAGTHQMSLPELEAGVYFVRLETGALSVTGKAVLLQ